MSILLILQNMVILMNLTTKFFWSQSARAQFAGARGEQIMKFAAMRYVGSCVILLKYATMTYFCSGELSHEICNHEIF